MNETGIIYAHINKENGAMYIGQTKNSLQQRFGFEGAAYSGCDYFYNAIQKYGWNNFDHIILEQNIPLNKLNDREAYWIKYYHTFVDDPEYKNGYNLTAGGAGSSGKTCSQETKEKISAANKGKTRTKEQLTRLSEAHKGKKQTEETKVKRRESLKGQKRTEEQKQHYKDAFIKRRSIPILCLETQKVFNNYQDAADWIGCAKGTINQHVLYPDEHKSVFGYHFIAINNS